MRPPAVVFDCPWHPRVPAPCLPLRIQRGSTLLFINDTSYPALIDGQPRHVEMVLKQVGKPGRRP